MVLSLFDQIHGRFNVLEQDLPLGSQLDLFRTADEKRLAQLLFQDLHRLAHSRLGDEQAFGGLGEA